MKIKIFLGLFFAIIIGTPCMQALQSIRLPFDKKLEIEDVNYGIKNGIRTSAATLVGYLVIKNIINAGKLMLDYPVSDPDLEILDLDLTNPDDQIIASLLYIGRSFFCALFAKFLYDGDFKKYPAGLFLSTFALWPYLPG